MNVDIEVISEDKKTFEHFENILENAIISIYRVEYCRDGEDTVSTRY